MAHSSSLASYAAPLAIVIAGVVVAGALFWSASGPSAGAEVEQAGANFRLPSVSDHMRGSPDAPVALIEFSDLECSFCARLHPTLAHIVEENPRVQWVYRHFPLTSIHSRALEAAIASECIARLGGNDAFWAFVDAVFAEQSPRLAASFYEEFAAGRGITRETFAQCMSDATVAERVAADNAEAIQSGGRGTPFVVIATARGALTPFSGALPYEDVKRLVDQALVDY